MSSGRRVNYRLRPAKAVERKMLCEIFRRLQPLARVDSFRYVGFGSHYFSDFIIFHRALNIHKMVSIEKDTFAKSRYTFNNPYKCIDLKFGSSNSELPKLKWKGTPSIVWLDYDGCLNAEGLNDLQVLCAELEPPSILVVSCNVETREDDADDQPARKSRLETLKEQVGETRVPNGTTEQSLAKWGKAAAVRDIITNEITAHLADRNALIEDESEKVFYRQLCNFTYADDAKMLSVGGIIYRGSHEHLVDACGFKQLPFCSSTTDAYHIAVPNLTVKEIKHLDSLLPKVRAGKFNLDWLQEEEIEQYQRIYRFFPTFTEAADL